ncbi:hypothetical protein ACHAWF_012357 [Thalassiosira exigua]
MAGAVEGVGSRAGIFIAICIFILSSPLVSAFATSTSRGSLGSAVEMADDVRRLGLGSRGNAIDKLRSLGMGKKDLPHHADLRRASILIPLFERFERHGGGNEKSGVHVLLTRRPDNMRSHAGEVKASPSILSSSMSHASLIRRLCSRLWDSKLKQVCFPGGRQDPDDGGDDVRTAVREAHEEVGLHPRHVEGIARMETVKSKHSLCVTPVIGLVRPPSEAEPSRLSLNAAEVEVAFAVPLEYFADPENCASIEKVRWRGGDFLLRTYLYDDPESGHQFKIWGLTAHVVHLVATAAFCE